MKILHGHISKSNLKYLSTQGNERGTKYLIQGNKSREKKIY